MRDAGNYGNYSNIDMVKSINAFLNEASKNTHFDSITSKDEKDDDKTSESVESVNYLDPALAMTISRRGLSELFHFLCEVYPQMRKLGHMVFSQPDGPNGHLVKRAVETYNFILEYATRLIIGSSFQDGIEADTIMVDAFLGLIRHSHDGEPCIRFDIPDYGFFCDVIGYAYDRLPISMMQRILRSMVHVKTRSIGFAALTWLLELAFEEDRFEIANIGLTAEEIEKKKEKDAAELEAEVANPKSKMKIYSQIKNSFMEQVGLLGINLYASLEDDENDDEGEDEVTGGVDAAEGSQQEV